jgi:hypothetical protein
MPSTRSGGITLIRRHNSDDSGSRGLENRTIRRLFPLVAALVLIAPSCPRDYGPGDYDPDATRTFAPGANVEDLVYVSANSAKGDSDYVVAMPRGDTVARIDGPDRRGWVFASPTLAYYSVLRHGPESSNTIHRIDLRTGSRARIVTDDRPGMQLLYESGPEFAALALTADKRRLLVARLLREDPRVWIGRYDATSGTLETSSSWPITGSAANVRLAVAGEILVVVTAVSVDGRVAQTMRVLDSDLRELAALSDSDLPPGERCSAALRALDGGRWVTVCANPDGRYGSVLVLDSSYRVSSRVPLKLDVREHVIAWTTQGGSVGILTDRGRHVRVASDGGLTSFWVGEPDGRTFLRIAREIAVGVIAVQFNVIAEGERVGDLAIVDVATGRLLVRATSADTAIDFVGAGDRLYVLVSGVGGAAPRLQRIDRDTLAPIGVAATLPQRDDVRADGLIALVTAR